MRLRTAVYLGCASILVLFVVSNVSLALTTRNYCIVVFQVPYIGRAFELPYWTWQICLLLAVVCALTIFVCWFAVLAGVLKRVWAEDVRRRARMIPDGKTFR